MATSPALFSGTQAVSARAQEVVCVLYFPHFHKVPHAWALLCLYSMPHHCLTPAQPLPKPPLPTEQPERLKTLPYFNPPGFPYTLKPNGKWCGRSCRSWASGFPRDSGPYLLCPHTPCSLAFGPWNAPSSLSAWSPHSCSSPSLSPCFLVISYSSLKSQEPFTHFPQKGLPWSTTFPYIHILTITITTTIYLCVHAFNIPQK